MDNDVDIALYRCCIIFRTHSLLSKQKYISSQLQDDGVVTVGGSCKLLSILTRGTVIRSWDLLDSQKSGFNKHLKPEFRRWYNPIPSMDSHPRVGRCLVPSLLFSRSDLLLQSHFTLDHAPYKTFDKFHRWHCQSTGT